MELNVQFYRQYYDRIEEEDQLINASVTFENGETLSLAVDEPDRESMEPNREHDCEIDGCHWEHMYGWVSCRYCGTDVPRNMTPAWMEE
jgi:hypothetical protein